MKNIEVINMNKYPMQKYEEWFKTYTNPFKEISNRYAKKGVLMKIDHSYRVEKLSDEISVSLQLSKKEIFISKVIGIFHDVGRFEQLKNYNTFNDLKSLDHAKLGTEILKKSDILSDFSNNEKELILKAIEYHNKYKIPNKEDKKTILFSNIIRDADKLDIYYVLANNLEPLSEKEEKEEFSEELIKTILNSKLIIKEKAKTKKDQLLNVISFVFDLNFKESFKILKEKKYLSKILKRATDKENSDKINNHIEKFIELKIKV